MCYSSIYSHVSNFLVSVKLTSCTDLKHYNNTTRSFFKAKILYNNQIQQIFYLTGLCPSLLRSTKIFNQSFISIFQTLPKSFIKALDLHILMVQSSLTVTKYSWFAGLKPTALTTPNECSNVARFTL